MLSNLHLENFQGFSEKVDIPIAPLTLVFGPNSSGKSSILRALRLMGQSFTPNALLGDNVFLANGFQVNLSSFGNLVSRHDENKTVTLGISVDAGSAATDFNEADFTFDKSMSLVRLQLRSQRTDSDSLSFELRFERSPDSVTTGETLWSLVGDSPQHYASLFNESISALAKDLSEPKHPTRPLMKILQSITTKTGFGLEEFFDKFRISTEDASKLNFRTSAFTPRLEIAARELPQGLDGKVSDREYKMVADTIAEGVEHKWVRLLGQIQQHVADQGMQHIRPLRQIPGRVQVLDADYGFNLGNNSEARARVSQWIEEITEGQYTLDFVSLTGSGGEIFPGVGALVLRDKVTSTLVSFEDAGVGLSQVLPILSWLASERDERQTRIRIPSAKEPPAPILLVEQPELHLHPRMQGAVMDLFVRSIADKANQVQIIAETHSEAFVLRVLSAIRAGLLSATDVSVIYVEWDMDSGCSVATPLEITPSGKFITEWPESFSSVRLDQLN